MRGLLDGEDSVGRETGGRGCRDGFAVALAGLAGRTRGARRRPRAKRRRLRARGPACLALLEVVTVMGCRFCLGGGARGGCSGLEGLDDDHGPAAGRAGRGEHRRLIGIGDRIGLAPRCRDAERLDRVLARKQPAPRQASRHARAPERQRVEGQHRISVLAAFALLDADHLALACRCPVTLSATTSEAPSPAP